MAIVAIFAVWAAASVPMVLAGWVDLPWPAVAGGAAAVAGTVAATAVVFHRSRSAGDGWDVVAVGLVVVFAVVSAAISSGRVLAP